MSNQWISLFSFLQEFWETCGERTILNIYEFFCSIYTRVFKASKDHADEEFVSLNPGWKPNKLKEVEKQKGPPKINQSGRE